MCGVGGGATGCERWASRRMRAAKRHGWICVFYWVMTHPYIYGWTQKQAFGAGADFVMLGGMLAGHDVRTYV